jgi:Domain of unknown function (DUF4326)
MGEAKRRKAAGADADMCAGMTPGDLLRRAAVLDGQAVVANMKTDHALIAWAKQNGRFARIDRQSEFGNPFVVGRDGDRAAVIAKHAELVRRDGVDVTPLRGMVCACWCHPEPCHGDLFMGTRPVPAAGL